MLSRNHNNNRGFTLVEVIVVAVIVAVLALVGIQLYQGYVTESRRNTAENLAASAAGFLQTIVNTYSADAPDSSAWVDDLGANQQWVIYFESGDSAVFRVPANATVTKGAGYDSVTATVNGVPSTGTYRYR